MVAGKGKTMKERKVYYVSRALCSGGPWKVWTLKGWRTKDYPVYLDTARDVLILQEALKLAYPGQANWNVNEEEVEEDDLETLDQSEIFFLD